MVQSRLENLRGWEYRSQSKGRNLRNWWVICEGPRVQRQESLEFGPFKDQERWRQLSSLSVCSLPGPLMGWYLPSLRVALSHSALWLAYQTSENTQRGAALFVIYMLLTWDVHQANRPCLARAAHRFHSLR